MLATRIYPPTPQPTTLAPLNNPGVPSFARATAATVVDFEGLIRPCRTGEARFAGARRVENLFANSEQFGGTGWSVQNIGGGNTQVSDDFATFPSGFTSSRKMVTTKNPNGYYQTPTGVFAGDVTCVSFWARGLNGGESIIVYNGGNTTTIFTITNIWKRYSVTKTVSGSNTHAIYNNTVNGSTIYIQGVQVEKVTGQTNQIASEYVSRGVLSAPYQGAGVDGVQYFPYQNGNTVDGSNVVTEAKGAAITGVSGYQAESAAQNKCTNYNVIPADTYAVALTAGASLVKGKKYEIASRATLDFTTVGAANNTAGTQFVATGTGPLGTGDSAKEVIFGVGLKAYYDGAAWQNPISGMTLSGDTKGVLSVVDDTAALTAAKLLNICPSGKVYKVDNSLGSTTATVVMGGTTGNTNPHSASLYARTASGTLTMRLSGNPMARTASTYGRISIVGITPSNGGQAIAIDAAAGSVVYFVLNQLEEAVAVSSPVIVQGAAATRNADALTYTPNASVRALNTFYR